MSYGIIPEIYMDKDFIHGNKLHGLYKEFVWISVTHWNTQF